MFRRILCLRKSFKPIYLVQLKFRSLAALFLGFLVAFVCICIFNRITLKPNSISLSNALSEYTKLKFKSSQSNFRSKEPSYLTKIYYDQVVNLRKNITVFCYINTYPENYATKAVHIHKTWAQRCTKHVFTSTKSDPILPVIGLNLSYPEVRMHLWSKMRKILLYVYKFRDQYDYFLKADDDTYIIMENLRHVLQHYSPNEPFMFGHRFGHTARNGYFSGGAGYLLSREALRRIVEKSIDKHPACPTYDENKEDIKMSICGQAVGVKLYDVNDLLGRNRFHWRSPNILLNMSSYKFLRWRPSKLTKRELYVLPHQSKLSDTAISFHYVEPTMIYILDYILYHLRPVGLINDFIELPHIPCSN